MRLAREQRQDILGKVRYELGMPEAEIRIRGNVLKIVAPIRTPVGVVYTTLGEGQTVLEAIADAEVFMAAAAEAERLRRRQ